MRIAFASGEIVGLVEGIIDDTSIIAVAIGQFPF